MSKRKASIIVPVYNEAENLEKLLEELDRVLKSLGNFVWEIVFVDDGSQDGSWDQIKSLAKKYPQYILKGIRLSRNFGKEIALTAGIESITDSDFAICIDADLQHPPSLIPEMVNRWEQGYEIVVAVRKSAEDFSWIRNIGSRFFYWLMNRYSSINLQPGSTDFRLLDKKVINTLKTFKERTRLFRGLIDWMGFQKTLVFFEAPSRGNGKSSFNFSLLMNLAINSFTSFSLLPLRFTGYLGIAITIFSFLLLIFMLITKFFMHWSYRPIAFFVVFNTFLMGVVLCALGLIALYIGHIHTEVVGRPLYIVKEIFGNQEHNL